MNGSHFSRLLFMVSFLCLIPQLSACRQEVYWDASTATEFYWVEEGKVEKGEERLQSALARARRELGDDYIAKSLFNLGTFYRRQQRLTEAIVHLREGLELNDKVFGLTSERSGKFLAELAAAHAMEQNLFDGRPFADRLKPLAGLFRDTDAAFVKMVLDIYEIDLEKYEREVNKLTRLADSGDPVAQYELANTYFDGPNAKELMPQILRLYETAANQGYANAQSYLGVMYRLGRGVNRDDQKAREWFRIAAKNNHSQGQYNYALSLMNGEGGPKDEKEARRWLEKSSAQGNRLALKLLQGLRGN